ncbi:sensor histidine kinase, partial [Poseidonibacter ostreae]
YDKKEVRRFKLYATKYPLNEEHLLFSLVDINDEYILKKNLEKEVKIKSEENLKQYQILQQRSKFAAMGEMIANIAHQWRQPINALSAYNLNIVIKYNKQALNDQIIEEFSNKSQMLINKMNSLITSFSNFFEPDKVKNRFNIKDSIYEALSLLEDTLALNKIKVNINCKTDIYLDGYKNEFEQIILNILNNSKDAFISKNKEDEITITISNNIIEEYLNIEIIDNAGGIEEDIVTRIFEPYFTTKEKDEGTGIGLYMCKVIIEQSMHGKIDMIN